MRSAAFRPPYGLGSGLFFTAVIGAFSIAQPLYDLLSQNPAFFTAHHATPADLVLIVAGLSIIVPALLCIPQLLARLAGKIAWALVHGDTLLGLAALLATPVLSRWLDAPDALILALALGFGAAFYVALIRRKSVRSLVSIAGIGMLVFPALFVLNPRIQPYFSDPESAQQLAPVTATAPVIFLVLDELPLTSLLDAERTIDRHRYPNFARLADTAWWFRNAITVSDDTVDGAVPAILTGQYPAEDVTYRESPTSLFTLLGGSYDLHVAETYTRVCPRDLCPQATLTAQRRASLLSDLWVVFGHIALPRGMRQSLPDISQGWKNFRQPQLSKAQARSQRLDKLWDSRAAWMDQFIAEIRPSDKPALYFLHVLLPHLPWTFLPNGNEYALDAQGLYGVPGVRKERWGGDNWAVTQGQQRHLLQLGYVDRKLGELLDRLDRQGLFEQALIVVTADHGVSFRTNDARRPLTNTNAAQILRIPLLIKAPGQQTGKINDAPVETVDILPTIAAMLSLDIPWEVDGLPAFDARVATRDVRRVYQQNRRPRAVATNISRRGFDKLDDGLTDKLALFGSGENPALYQVGEHAALIGKPLAALTVLPTNDDSSTVSLDPIAHGNGAPWAITGVLEARQSGDAIQHLAAIADDRVCAVTRSYANSATASAFVFFVGPSCDLDDTRNVEVLRIDASRGPDTLSRLHKRDID